MLYKAEKLHTSATNSDKKMQNFVLILPKYPFFHFGGISKRVL